MGKYKKRVCASRIIPLFAYITIQNLYFYIFSIIIMLRLNVFFPKKWGKFSYLILILLIIAIYNGSSKIYTAILLKTIKSCTKFGNYCHTYTSPELNYYLYTWIYSLFLLFLIWATIYWIYEYKQLKQTKNTEIWGATTIISEKTNNSEVPGDKIMTELASVSLFNILMGILGFFVVLILFFVAKFYFNS